MPRLCVLLPLSIVVVACCASVVLAGDRTLGTVSGLCKDQFTSIMKDQYATDKDCADTIRKAMNTAPKTDADCPGGAKADVGSSVQKCMSKDQVGVCFGGDAESRQHDTAGSVLEAGREAELWWPLPPPRVIQTGTVCQAPAGSTHHGTQQHNAELCTCVCLRL